MELVDQPHKEFLGLSQGRLFGAPSLNDDLEVHPKNLESLINIPFLSTLRAIQPFPVSLKYYSRFIEDYAVYAAVLYEL